VKALKILGLAAVLVLMSGAIAYGADQVIDQVQGDDTATDGRVCNENCLRVNNPADTGQEVRTQTRTRLAWEEDAECVSECDGDQDRLRTQDRLSWPEEPSEDDPTRSLTQTRASQTSEDPVAPAVGGARGNGACD